MALEPASGHGIGVARFVRSADDPEVAEVAVAVADSWQNRGVATALLGRLTQRAREEGVRRFSAEILADNRPMLELIEELGDVTMRHLDHGSVRIELELPPRASAPRCASRCERPRASCCGCPRCAAESSLRRSSATTPADGGRPSRARSMPRRAPIS